MMSGCIAAAEGFPGELAALECMSSLKTEVTCVALPHSSAADCTFCAGKLSALSCTAQAAQERKGAARQASNACHRPSKHQHLTS